MAESTRVFAEGRCAENRERMLRAQVKFMRGIILDLDKTLAEITKRPTPKLPDVVFENI